MKKITFALTVAASLAAPLMAVQAQNTSTHQTVIQVDTANRRMSVGIDPSIASPTATLDVSGSTKLTGAVTLSGDQAITGSLSASGSVSAASFVSGSVLSLKQNSVTPTLLPIGTLALNVSGSLCVVSPSGVYVKVVSPGTACNFSPAN